MSRLTSFLLVLFFLGAVLCLLTPSVRADDSEVDVETDAAPATGAGEGATGEEDKEEVTEETTTDEAATPTPWALVPSPDVTTTVHFIGATDKKFTVGEEMTALVGLSNTGDKTYNVTYIGAQLRSPFDYTYIVQNFTVWARAVELGPNSEATIEYKFTPDVNLEPADFHLSGFVGYNGTDLEPFQSTFINGTVTLTERKSDVDARTLFTYVCVVSAFGLIAYIFVSMNKVAAKKRGGAGARAAPVEWETKIYKPSAKSRAVGQKASSSKNKSS